MPSARASTSSAGKPQAWSLLSSITHLLTRRCCVCSFTFQSAPCHFCCSTTSRFVRATSPSQSLWVHLIIKKYHIFWHFSLIFCISSDSSLPLLLSSHHPRNKVSFKKKKCHFSRIRHEIRELKVSRLTKTGPDSGECRSCSLFPWLLSFV